MTDGAARTLLESRNSRLIDRAVPHLTSRDPGQFWTSGQWMTESTGGSDVGLSQTSARRDASGVWRLNGKKWFTSAANSQMALTLARPEGNGPGGSGLALFYLETRRADHSLNGIRIERLKDKLGTRKVHPRQGSIADLDGNLENVIEIRRSTTRHLHREIQLLAPNRAAGNLPARHCVGLLRFRDGSMCQAAPLERPGDCRPDRLLQTRERASGIMIEVQILGVPSAGGQHAHGSPALQNETRTLRAPIKASQQALLKGIADFGESSHAAVA